MSTYVITPPTGPAVVVYERPPVGLPSALPAGGDDGDLLVRDESTGARWEDPDDAVDIPDPTLFFENALV